MRYWAHVLRQWILTSLRAGCLAFTQMTKLLQKGCHTQMTWLSGNPYRSLLWIIGKQTIHHRYFFFASTMLPWWPHFYFKIPSGRRNRYSIIRKSTISKSASVRSCELWSLDKNNGAHRLINWQCKSNRSIIDLCPPSRLLSTSENNIFQTWKG